MRFRVSPWLFSMLLIVGTAVYSNGRSALGGEEPPIHLLLDPAPPPVPALKYQLLPTMYERRPGNAAVFYGRVRAERISFFSNKEIWDQIHRAQDAPLDEVRGMDRLLTYVSWVLKDLERGGQCENCDWQYPLAEDGYGTLVPDVTECRRYARLLNAGARKHLAQGEFDQTVETLKVGYALARHTSDAPILVPGLVGVAVSDMMSDRVLELVQQPGAPNLYWALTYLPQPLLDFRSAFEGEMLCIGYQLPSLSQADRSVPSPDYWRLQVQDMLRVFEEQLVNSEEDVPRFQSMMALRLLRGYPLAKRALMASGISSQEVDGMPVGQVLLLDTARQFAACRDEHLKWITAPYWTVAKGLEEADRQVSQADRGWGAALPVMEFFPGYQAARTMFVRVDRRIAVLRVIEALRLYGAAHGGRLPARLEDISEVPMPVDPVTGKPFEYQLVGEAAVLGGPRISGAPLRYEIRLRADNSR